MGAKVKYKIVDETDKAIRVKVKDALVWLPKAWVEPDGKLGPKAARKVDIAIEDRAADTASVTYSIAWENDRSVAIDYEAVFAIDPTINRKPKRVRAFIGRSHKAIRELDDESVTIPGWLDRKLRQEALERDRYIRDPDHWTVVGEWD